MRILRGLQVTLNVIVSVLVRDRQIHSRGGDVRMKHKVGATSHGIPQVPRNWKRQRTRPPRSVWRERSKADTLILGFWNSDCERINLSF